MALTGRCHCGTVQYAVQGELTYVVHCHCVNCRRSHGAAFFTGAFLPTDRFEVTAGADRVRTAPFQGDVPGGRCFCTECGSRVFNRLDMMPGLMNFSLATLDEAPASVPAIHINTESKVPWIEIPAGAEQHETFPPDLPQQMERLLHGG